MAEAAQLMAPQQQQDADPLEAASRRANQVFRELTRQRMAEAEAGVRRSGPRPFFASASRAAAGTECTGPDCWVCAEGRRMEAARHDSDPYPPGAVITTDYYREIAR
jgi:hypothetical protein